MALFLTICSLNKAVGGQPTYDARGAIGAYLEPGLKSRLLSRRETVRQCVRADAALTWQGVPLADLEFNRNLKRGPDFGGSAKAAYLPALNRYDGRFFHALGPDGRQRLGASKHHTLFVSGLYGLLRPTEPIQLYSCPLRHQVATMWASDGVLTDVLCQYIAQHKVSKVFDLTAVDAYRRLIDWDRVAGTGTDVLHCFDAMGAGDYALISFAQVLASELLERSEQALADIQPGTEIGRVRFLSWRQPPSDYPQEEEITAILSARLEAESLEPQPASVLPEYIRGGIADPPAGATAVHDGEPEWRFTAASKFTKELNRHLGIFDSVLRAIEAIRRRPTTPRGNTVKPLKGDLHGSWRYRLRGDYRLVYEPDTSRRVISLLSISHRKDVYD